MACPWCEGGGCAQCGDPPPKPFLPMVYPTEAPTWKPPTPQQIKDAYEEGQRLGAEMRAKRAIKSPFCSCACASTLATVIQRITDLERKLDRVKLDP